MTDCHGVHGRIGMISIIVPVYNTKEYLTRCVESLRVQTCSDLEILLVDDGSTDGSGALCDRLAGEDERIRVLHKENGGSSTARNAGIAEARGEFVGFVDSDDYVDADMYERLLEAVCRYQVNAAQIGRDEIAPDGTKLPDICTPPEEPECIRPERFLEELLMHRGDCSFCTKLIRRQALEEYLSGKSGGESTEDLPDSGEYFPVGVLNEDFHLLIELLDHLGPIVSLPGHAYHVFYRLGSNSRKADKNSFSRVYEDSVNNADMAAELVEGNYPGLREVAFRFGIFQRLEYMLHIPVAQMCRENDFYRKTVKYLRKNWIRAMRNPILTGKNKRYHTLFAAAPKTVRRIHGILMMAKTTVQKR